MSDATVADRFICKNSGAKAISVRTSGAFLLVEHESSSLRQCSLAYDNSQHDLLSLSGVAVSSFRLTGEDVIYLTDTE